MAKTLRCTVEEVKERISVKEFNEWQLYEQFNVDPTVRLEYYLAQLTSVLANVNRDKKKTPKPYTTEYFLLFKESIDVNDKVKAGMSNAEVSSMRMHIDMLTGKGRKNKKKKK